MKKIILPIILGLIIFVPMASHAASVTLNCYNTGDCGFCDAVELASKIVRFIIGLSGSFALLFFVWAGFKMILSHGNAGKFSEAQKMMTTAVVGIFIVLLSWTIVNFIIATLISGDGQGSGVSKIFSKPWQTIDCTKKASYTKPINDGSAGGSGGTGGSTGGCVSVWNGESGNSCGGNCVSFPSRNAKQCADASPSLVDLLFAIDKELTINKKDYTLKKEDIIITSISDSNGLSFCRDNYPRQCDTSKKITTNCCWHMKNSCHYGEKGSYAIDVSFNRIPYLLSPQLPDQRFLDLQNIVKKNNGYFKVEDDHYHISTPECTGN